MIKPFVGARTDPAYEDPIATDPVISKLLDGSVVLIPILPVKLELDEDTLSFSCD